MRFLAALVIALALLEYRTVNAQPDPGTRSQERDTARVEVEPIECWWRSTATAVRVGETFTVILTCSVLQAEAVRVIPDESRLEPTVVQLPPFEVVGGTHPKDIVTAGRRFFQFSYQLRVIAENVFASTVSLPALEITYKIESRMDEGDAIAGRDQAYALPAMAMRVLSLVPDTTTDIREAAVATFTELEDVGFRGTMMRVLGWVLLSLGGLVLALALVTAVRRWRAESPKTRLLPATVILHGVRRELATIQEQSRGGWTSDLAGRALAALRIVVAYTLGRPVTQRLVDRGHADVAQRLSAGELAINGRRGTTAVVSAAVTPEHARDELRDALARFSAARYGRDNTFDATLDDPLETGIRTTDQLIASRPALERLWPR